MPCRRSRGGRHRSAREMHRGRALAGSAAARRRLSWTASSDRTGPLAALPWRSAPRPRRCARSAGCAPSGGGHGSPRAVAGRKRQKKEAPAPAVQISKGWGPSWGQLRGGRSQMVGPGVAGERSKCARMTARKVAPLGLGCTSVPRARIVVGVPGHQTSTSSRESAPMAPNFIPIRDLGTAFGADFRATLRTSAPRASPPSASPM